MVSKICGKMLVLDYWIVTYASFELTVDPRPLKVCAAFWKLVYFEKCDNSLKNISSI